MPSHFPSIPLFMVLSAVRASMIAEWGQTFALTLRICRFLIQPVDWWWYMCFCTSASTPLLIFIFHSVLASQSVTRIKKQLVNHYRRSTASLFPTYCGKIFPSITGICSHKMREYFPKQSGMFSHNMREYFPTIYGKIGTCIIWLIFAPSSLKRTGLNQIKCGCPHWFSLCYFEIRIPIGVFLRLSYTENECKSLSLSPTFQEINGTGRF